MNKNIRKLLSIVLPVIMLFIIVLCGYETNRSEIKCKFKDFKGDYSFKDYQDEEVWQILSWINIYYTIYEKQQGEEDARWVEKENGKMSTIFDISTKGYLTLAGGTVEFAEKQIEQVFVDEIKQVIATIGKNFKLTDKEFVCLDSGKTYNISKVRVNKETNKGYIDFADFEYRDMSAEFSYYGCSKTLSIIIWDDVILSDIKYSYSIEFDELHK